MGTFLLSALLMLVPTAEAPAGEVPEEPGETEWFALPLYGGHLGVPLELSATLGLGFGKRTINPYGAPGAVLFVEPGLGGGKLGVGYGYLSLFGATSGQVVVLRTWDSPREADPRATYYGIEGQTPVFIPRSILRAGVFWSASAETERDWFISVSVGYGLF